MSIKYFIGKAPSVVQVWDASVDSVDGTPADNDFTLTIGNTTVTVPGDTDAQTTAAALVSAATTRGTTDAWWGAISFTAPGAGVVTATAAVAGVPFDVALSVSGGGSGSVTDFSETTPSAGPAHFLTAGNWAGGVAPVNDDDLVIQNLSSNICYDLATGLTVNSLTVPKSFTGRIGLPSNQFTDDADGSNTVSTKHEYRQTYLQIGCDVIDLGFDSGSGSPAGSPRIKIDNNQSAASVLTVHSSSTSSDTNRPAIMYLAAHANADVFVRSAPGSFGIAVDAPDETSTVGDVNVTATGTVSKIQIGAGVTMTNFIQNGGANKVNAAATVTKLEVNGGTVVTEGAFGITTLEVNGGTCTSNATGTIAAANVNGGTLDFLGNNQARTVTALTQNGGTIYEDDEFLTVTATTRPTGRKATTVALAA